MHHAHTKKRKRTTDMCMVVEEARPHFMPLTTDSHTITSTPPQHSSSQAMLKWLASSPAAGALKLNSSDQSLTTSEGDLIKEPNAIARALAKSLSPTLICGSSSSSPVEQAQVIQWQSWSTTEGQDVFAKAVELNAFLESRSFLVGSTPTLADISVYFALAPGVQLSFPGPLGGLTHLMRWFDQIQNVLRSGQAFAGHDQSLLPKVVPLHSIYKPLVMPVFGKLTGVGGKGAGAPGLSLIHI